MERVKFECCHVDTCLSDYWSGHHLPHVQIPVWHGMSLKEIKQAIRDEVNFGYVSGNCDEARLISADWIGDPKDIKKSDMLVKAVYAAINRIKPAKKGQRKFFTDIAPIDDQDIDDHVYAYFVFVEI